jgi:signal-transduction protein with cAMP-binding, CBS, and nucleotidyltransferase domain
VEGEKIKEAIHHFFAFNDLLDDPDQTEVLLKAFEMKDFEQGTTLIEQGSEGLEFFVLLEGEVECSVEGAGVVKTCTGGSENCFFGELALLYSNPRAATVAATSAIKVAVLDGESFKHIATAAQILKDKAEAEAADNAVEGGEKDSAADAGTKADDEQEGGGESNGEEGGTSAYDAEIKAQKRELLQQKLRRHKVEL